jgi:predicted nucleic acid-binding protein
MDRMFDVGESLRNALEDARRRLGEAQSAIAHSNAGAQAGRSADAAMAATAQAAIFTEALLTADRARFEEIKAVLK